VRASAITQYGIPMGDGGRACEFNVGEVKVFLTGPESVDTRFVAESLRAYWNADCEPKAGAPTSDFAGVEAVCRRIAGGAPLVHGEFSVGPWTPAVDDGFAWAVLDKRGSPLLLAHDAFEAAIHFCRLVEGSMGVDDNAGGPYRLPADSVLAERAREDRLGGGW
jgi:hypothetical protein